MDTVRHLINCELLSGTGRPVPACDRARGRPVRRVGLADAAVVHRAVAAAGAAFPPWRDTPAANRAQILFRFMPLLERHEASICELIAQEHGKTLEDAAGELRRGIHADGRDGLRFHTRRRPDMRRSSRTTFAFAGRH